MSPESEFFMHPNLLGVRGDPHVNAFLHVGRLVDRALPHLLEKVLRVMQAADRWGQLRPGRFHVRVCEYHEYMKGGEVCDPHHCDGGSLVTMSVLLSDAAEFTGGDFTTLGEDGEVTRYNFQRGDALVFPSEKWHSVQVVETGCRRTLVTELWDGPRCLVDREH